MINPYKSQALTNLKKVLGQTKRIIKMIEGNEYCIDIAQQNNAAIGLLKKTNSYILESHLLTCGTKQLVSKNSQIRQIFAKELIRVCNIANR